MADEKRLVDVMPFMKTGWHLVRTGKSNEHLASMSLADVPTIDAVEVVRCKDCKRRANTKEPNVVYCKTLNRFRAALDFCSYGERKDNG